MLILREMLHIWMITTSAMTKATAIHSCIREVTVPNPARLRHRQLCLDLVVPTSPLRQYRIRTSNYKTTVSFNILSNSLFTKIKFYDAMFADY
jgi:hypothetical protein